MTPLVQVFLAALKQVVSGMVGLVTLMGHRLTRLFFHRLGRWLVQFFLAAFEPIVLAVLSLLALLGQALAGLFVLIGHGDGYLLVGSLQSELSDRSMTHYLKHHQLSRAADTIV